jgi:hypothetical protein
MKHDRLTITFYENPAALAEIEFWEQSMANEIRRKTNLGHDILYYLNKKEAVYCTPIDKPSLKTINELLESKDYVYNKTLIFGKVNSEQLDTIRNFCLTQENKHE